jgi:branched-chain amino acid transport system permease protein
MTQFLQLMVSGLALGFAYALVALGFVIIYKATEVINFAQGGFVMIGAYLIYNFNTTWGVPFALAVVLAMATTAGIALVFERLILRRMVGSPVFAQVMITIGLLFILQNLVTAIWGAENLNLGDPWGIDTVRIGEIAIQVRHLWSVGLAIALLGAFFAFFRFTPLGLAMRATAIDQEAALAQGMSSKRVYMAAWGIAGASAAIAGLTIASGATSLSPTIQYFALLAFPAIILGGIDSPLGAVVGGLIIGVTQSLTAGYQEDFAPWLGTGFQSVMPFVVMVLVLLIRPYGLFGTPDVKRV